MSENKLPPWAIDGLRDAGVSAEGWEPHDLPDWVVWNREPHRFEVCERGEWLDILGPDGESVAFEVESVPDAFRLAARLAAALENKPDPRVVELEKEVARLNRAIDEATREFDLSIGRTSEADAQNPDAAYIFMGGDAWFGVMEAETLAGEVRKRRGGTNGE